MPYICDICQKQYTKVQSLSAHKRSHTDYIHLPVYIRCCSLLTKQEIQVLWLDRHEKAYLKKLKRCLQCGKEHTKPKFCSRSCAGTWNNLHSSPDRKRGPDPKPRPKQEPKPIKYKTHPPKDIKYPYTYVHLNTCAKTGRLFYSKSYRKYHPDLKETKLDYTRSCQYKFGLRKFPLWFDTSLIKKYGMYSTPGSRAGKRNLNGVSRDHMLSITYGWENDITPSLLRHPANCKLVRHLDNQRKNTKSSISVEELKHLIIKFEKLYPNWMSI